LGEGRGAGIKGEGRKEEESLRSSRIPGFHEMSLEERLRVVKEFAGLTDEEVGILRNTGSLGLELADRMIENVIGATHLPLGVATNFLINGKDYLIPMALEEPSVVAAASNAARMARMRYGFRASADEPVMIGQVQVCKLRDPQAARERILEERGRILERANEQDPVLVKAGGGARDLEVRVLSTRLGPMVVVHLLVDVRDAMGANAVNTMCEAVAPLIEELTGGKVYLRIISNLATHRMARAEASFPKEALGGEEVVEGILHAHALAEADPYRCATHNKGIMNGIIAVALALSNDTRALEAGGPRLRGAGGLRPPHLLGEGGERGPQGEDRAAHRGGHPGRGRERPSGGQGLPQDPGGELGQGAGRGDGGGGAGPEPGRPQGPGGGGHPEGAHEAARQERGHSRGGQGGAGGEGGEEDGGGEVHQDRQGQGDPGGAGGGLAPQPRVRFPGGPGSGAARRLPALPLYKAPPKK